MGKSISVIIPAYNAQNYIIACLSSLSEQNFKNFEIIVSNDGSTDNTLYIVQDFIASHPDLDISVISNPNGGVSLARKRALEKATGDWITFVDADDTLPPNALSDLFSQTDDNTDLVVGFMTPPNEPIKDMPTARLWHKAVLDGTIPPTPWGKLYRRTVLKPHMLDVPRYITNGEDALMNIMYAFAMTKPPRFVYSNVYNYTRNIFSLSHNTKRNLDYEFEYDNLRMRAIPQSFHSEYMSCITKYRINGVLGCMKSDAGTIAKKSHPFFKVIREGISQTNYKLSPFEWIALNVKSPYLIKSTGFIRTVYLSLNYRFSLLFKRKNKRSN